MSGGRGCLEVGRRLSLDNCYFHNRISAVGSCEMLSQVSGLKMRAEVLLKI